MKKENLMTLGQVAERLDVPTYTLAYAIQKGRIKPYCRVGITRVWVEADLPRIRAVLAGIKKRRTGKS